MKTTIKRLCCLTLSLLVVLSLAACGEKEPPVASGTVTTPPEAAATPEAVEETGWKPTKAIHIVGQSAAGSGPDMFIRVMQPWLQENLGAAVVVENAPGSGGKIACTQVWKAKADGYTLLAHSSPLTTVTQVSKNCEYNIPDFKHIISFDSTPYAIVVKKGSEIDSFDKLVELSKTKKLSNSNSGIGGAMYLQSMIMKKSLDIDYEEVPYDGSNPCVLAVMNGDVTMSIVAYDSVINNQDEVTILALLSDERLSVLPDVPTTKELGYDFPCLSMRRGVVAPPDTPQEVVDRLIEAFDVAVNTPEFQEYVENSGISMDVKLGEDYLAIDNEYYETVMKYAEYLE